jgi:hypothetical protein
MNHWLPNYLYLKTVISRLDLRGRLKKGKYLMALKIRGLRYMFK